MGSSASTGGRGDDLTPREYRFAFNIDTGARIKALRRKKGLTTAEVAKHLGYKDGTVINHIEEGRNSIPSWALVDLAELLGCTLNAILVGRKKREQGK